MASSEKKNIDFSFKTKIFLKFVVPSEKKKSQIQNFEEHKRVPLAELLSEQHTCAARMIFREENVFLTSKVNIDLAIYTLTRPGLLVSMSFLDMRPNMILEIWGKL